MKIKLFVISIILVLIFLQFRVINQVNNKFEILQAENPNKDQFEKIGNAYPQYSLMYQRTSLTSKYS